MPKKVSDATPEIAKDPVVVIDLDGELFTFPRDQDEWPIGAIVAAGRVASGRSTYDDVVECLLGSDQWDRLKLLPFRNFKQFLALFSAAMDEINSQS
jgi:hypothetical protein